MDWPQLAWIVLGSGLGIAGGFYVVRLVWHLRSRWRIRRAGPRRLLATRHRIWHEPDVSGPADLRFGPGGREAAPAPPYAFVEEHARGSQPCVAVRDARSRLWRVKWGHEVRPESFAVRFAWSCGYFAEVTHYVAEGRIEGAANLARARNCVDQDGRFVDARFELEDRSVRMFFDEHSWSWNDNPFVGTKQLSGLKIVNMLLSNWDTKDRRDVSRGSNTAIFEYPISRWAREARYLITDWGGAMGKWGTTVVSRGRWDPDGFAAQTPSFVTGVRDGYVNFGYQGQRTAEITRGITIEHAEWFYRYARRLTDEALRTGLRASGATEEEAAKFAAALRDRIGQLGAAAGYAAEEPQRTIQAG
jgi:hypothetical protein